MLVWVLSCEAEAAVQPAAAAAADLLALATQPKQHAQTLQGMCALLKNPAPNVDS